MSIVEAFNAEQERQGLSDTEAARRLGVTYHCIYLFKKGKRRPGNKLLTAMMQQFPALTVDVMNHMKGEPGQP